MWLSSLLKKAPYLLAFVAIASLLAPAAQSIRIGDDTSGHWLRTATNDCPTEMICVVWVPYGSSQPLGEPCCIDSADRFDEYASCGSSFRHAH